MYLDIDDAYVDWYKERYNITTSKRMVLSVQHALQGHPESRKTWMEMIKKIIIN